MDVLLSWLIFGSMIGFFSDLGGISPEHQRFPSSIMYGIFGATLGGGLGGLINDITFIPVAPLLYVLSTSFFLVLLPKPFLKFERKIHAK